MSLKFVYPVLRFAVDRKAFGAWYFKGPLDSFAQCSVSYEKGLC